MGYLERERLLEGREVGINLGVVSRRLGVEYD